MYPENPEGTRAIVGIISILYDEYPAQGRHLRRLGAVAHSPQEKKSKNQKRDKLPPKKKLK